MIKKIVLLSLILVLCFVLCIPSYAQDEVKQNTDISVKEADTNNIKLNEATYDNSFGVYLADKKIINKRNYDILGVNLTQVFYDTKESKVITKDKLPINSIGLKAGETCEYDTIYSLYAYDNDKANENKIYIGSVIKEIMVYPTYAESPNVKSRVNNYKVTVYYEENPSYFNKLNYLQSQESIKQALESDKTSKDILKNQLSNELKANQNIPLKIIDKNISYNSIGTPEANITFKNLSNKTVDAFEVTIKCYDTYDRLVKESISNESAFYGISQNENMKIGETVCDTWTLYLFDNTTKINVYVTSVHFTDGTVWKK